MNILITICARAGSKRLPGKNIKKFCGKPLIEWTVLQAELFREKLKNIHIVDIAICTDILEVQILLEDSDYPVFFVDRPYSLSIDDVPKLSVIKYVFKESEKIKYSGYYDCIVDLDVTSPLRKLSDIDSALMQYRYGCLSTLFSVVSSRRKPCFNQVKKINDVISIYEDGINCFYYDMNASIYIYNAHWMHLNGEYTSTPIQKNSKLYIMEEWQGFDIDTAFDFQLVQAIFKAKLLKQYEELI